MDQITNSLAQAVWGSDQLSDNEQVHLARFLAPICQGQFVRISGRLSPAAIDALGAAHIPPDDQAADVLVCLDPAMSPWLLDQATDLLKNTPILALLTEQEPPAPPAPYMAHYVHRRLSGSLIADARFARARIAALHDGTVAGRAALHLWLFAAEHPPDLPGGVFENDGFSVQKLRTPIYTAPPPRLKQPDQAAEKLEEMTARAVALGERLLTVDARTFELRRKIAELERKQAFQGPAEGKTFFDVPKTAHPWPLAENPNRMSETLGLYDRRVDDAVVLEGRRGQAFMKSFALESESPDYAGCVEALNTMSPTLRVPDEAPDVSIVIPVYGQLAYTLNCIDSILSHKSRYSAEILVIDDCSPDSVTDVFVPKIHHVRYHRQPQNGGFINSCNTGGNLARGRFILMLNNDTRVVEGWLDALIDSFALFPAAGLVGSKMCYADGSLQEAGGILWRDGSAWNYGRNDDPNRPQYCYARQVDYISGCSIILKTELWRELGGFDPHYTPAYSEDADLCLRVAASGREVWYQPQSRVVHYEGKTGGTDTATGPKAYQIVNMKKVFLRWRETLETHRPNGEAPFLERERKVTKRFLVIDAVVPTPNQDAGSVQTVLALRCCRNIGYKTHFVAEDNWLYVPGYTTDLQREGIDCAYAPYELGFEAYIRRYGWSFDVVMVYRASVLDRTLGLLRQYAPQATVIYHVADLHFLRMERQAALDDSEFAFAEAASMKKKELELVRSADCTITHSTVEAKILSEEAPDASVCMWPLMFDYFGTKVRFEARRDICFLGGYRHPPNVDAVQYFIREIFPLVKAAIPEVRFIVAGANPTGEIIELESDDVIVTGLVEDLRDVFDRSRVFVNPLRVGAGAKGKVMSALSYGLPVVSTPIGVEGAGLTPGKHVLVAETAQQMAQSIIRLYQNQTMWEKLSKNGQRLVKEQFSTDMGNRKLSEAIDKAYRHKLGLQ